ncbi:hypothetical protein [Thioflexithrix psekupsensis]|uniref:DUF4351 domain-containing protein n=1 Tax=Thioflexithrix psekupsensis TaxID=1570016 RepID=A0A251X5U1_9GAMM|nr:hypothetical protein [Thioflexithrix psekupsensis]OUD12559.1 hypothetical protein TPSD3_15865 [Thioflexithrix psekupsensis]
MKYDVTFKELFPDVNVLFKLLAGSEVVRIESAEFSSIKQRRADLLAYLADGTLLHLELQSGNDEEMLWRELEYCGLIGKAYKMIPTQIVLYIGKNPALFETQIDTPCLKYSYQVIDIRELDCTLLLESDSLSDNMLSLLGQLQDKQAAIQRVLRKIAYLPSKKRADTLAKLAILVGLRPKELPDLLKKEKTMPITVDLEENPIFAEIFERYTSVGEKRGIQIGEERGIQIGEGRGIVLGKSAMLRRLLEKRFYPLPDWVETKLEHASDNELEMWGLQLFEAQSLEDVFKL